MLYTLKAHTAYAIPRESLRVIFYVYVIHTRYIDYCVHMPSRCMSSVVRFGVLPGFFYVRGSRGSFSDKVKEGASDQMINTY